MLSATVAVLLLAFTLKAPAQMRVYDFTTSQGLKIKIIQDSEMAFIHAQLIIFYDVNSKYLSSPAIPYFILFDIFEEGYERASGNLAGRLQKMGDNFDYQHTPEYLRISFNFLPGRESTFAAFLNDFFTYTPFSLKKFNRIKNNFWNIFRRGHSWKKDLAFLIAYRQLFGEGFLGNTLMTPEQIRVVNLAQVNSFFDKNVRADHAQLVIRGNVNPYQFLGIIKTEMNFNSTPVTLQKPMERIAPNIGRKIFLVPSRDGEAPGLFFLDLAPAFDTPHFLSFFIVEYSLFHYPFGRIYQSRSPTLLQTRNYPLRNEVINQREVSVICSYTTVQPSDLETVIMQVDLEKKRLPQQQIRREEFANALNFLLGKARIDSSHASSEVEVEIGKAIAENAPVFVAPSADLMQRVSFDGLGPVVDEFFSLQRGSGRERGVVVIIGNEEQILAQWKGPKPEIIRLID